VARGAPGDRAGDRHAARRRLKSRALRFAGCAVLAALALLAALQLWYFLHIVWWRAFNPGETAFMTLRLDALREKNPRAVIRQQWVDYPRISPHLKRAMIAAEDARFVEHEGFDWDGIQKAMARNDRRGRIVAGGSTITQQLAKNLFLSGERSYVRKAQEAVITVMLEAVLDKDRILEIYLNVIEWGSDVFGCEAAARRHFATSCAALGREQAARLAAMAPNPRFYERNPGAPGLQRKIAIILARMPAAGLP
jgi:monofunctional biosynthetic peptidoglycan transglycosylase